MKVLELFSGTASVSRAFKIKGHKTISVDNEEKFRPTFVWDIGQHPISKYKELEPDVVWASPPCKKFSVASIGKYWNKDKTPRNDEAKQAIELIRKTLDIIDELNPEVWFIENPRGMLRKMPVMENLHRRTVTYCQYGDGRMKPTDIWTNALDWNPRTPCKNGDPCHIPAPRGSRTGTQGIKSDIDRGRIPQALCDEIVKYCEKKMKGKREWELKQ